MITDETNKPNLNELHFADDISLIYDDEGQLQNYINSLSTKYEKYNIKTNAHKLETVKISL